MPGKTSKRPKSKSKSSKNKKTTAFEKDVRAMMHGFGDVQDPLPDTVKVVQQLVVEFITRMTDLSTQVTVKRDRLRIENLLFVIRKDKKKYARALKLFTAHKDISSQKGIAGL
mmetsp:Transcript_1377/g.1839  ORF Transcript_1377/g.1839 Transcript_1377/m.1839 type:complete len:113 (+) Transcript_1377:44-382(+)